MPMPTHLYYTPPDGPEIKFLGQNRTLGVQNDTALSMVCRLNAGGNFISPTNDTGMYRSWTDDITYMLTDSIITGRRSDSLNYSKIQAYTAPDNVYKTGRSMAEGSTNNLTWAVPVHPGYRYLVRLHFCEFFSEVKINERRFDILIDNLTAEEGFDVIESSGGNLIPIYKDYIVAAGKQGGTTDYLLHIMIRPNAFSQYPDGFLNGMEVFRLNNTDGNLAGPSSPSSIPPPPPPPPLAPGQPSPTKKSERLKTLLMVIFGTVIGLLVVLSLFCCVVFWRMKKRKNHHGNYHKLVSCCGWLKAHKGQSTRTTASSLPKELCRQFLLDEIRAATNNFDESLVIGRGGFGNVYKGDFDEGAMTVAIKRLHRGSSQGPHEFKTEIEMLSQLRHLHLVSLIGYCNDEGEMILVYDYINNGTLKDYLYDTNNDPLPWKKRLEICLGAARGFDYLHAGAAHTVIHRDVKTTNILLNENWTAKVSDFGLSKIGESNTAVSTIVKGTWGYLDPEYARTKQLTDKSDVYSFGVVLFEVLCARKPLDKKLKEEQWSLAKWALKCIQNGTIHQVIDPYLMGKISPDCFNKFVEIAESCVRDNGMERPSMHDVMERLEFALQLQQAADAENKETNPYGVYTYPEVSFRANRYATVDIFGESSTCMATNATGVSSLISLESGTTASTQTSFL